MLTDLIKGKFIHLIAVLLLAVLSCMPVANLMSASIKNTLQTTQATAARILTPCQQQKNAQTQVTKICPTSTIQYSILPEILFTFLSTSAKATFLFILGLLAMSPISRIFKPPRFSFAA